MATDKGRKDKRTDDDDDDDSDEEGSSGQRHGRDSLEQIFSSSNWRRSVENVVHELQRKNDRLLRKNRELREQVSEFEEHQPADGAIVLSKDDAAVYEEFKKLNLKPADITAAIAERDTLKAKDTERSDEEKYADAAEALGYENVALFTRMLKREGLHLEFRDVREKTDDGKTVVSKIPMVRPSKDDKAALEPLNDYLEREMPEIVPVLQSEPASDGESEELDGEELSGVGAAATRGGREFASRRPTEATGGVRIPVTRGARPSTGAAREDRRLDERLEQKRAAGGYRL